MSTAASLLQKDFPWITSPLIVSAPTRPYDGISLSVPVSLAGGLGFLSYDPKHPDGDLSRASGLLKSITESPTKRSPSGLLPIGIGYLIFNDGFLDVARKQISEFRPCAVWLFAPTPKSIGDPNGTLEAWSQMIREASPDTRIWVQAGSVAGAIEAVRACAPSRITLIAQGIDAGGHGLSAGAGLVSLLPEMKDGLAGQFGAEEASKIAVLAAGGIAEARGAAAALALGADGVAMGTRFLTAAESAAPPGFREAILAAQDGGQATLRTQLYDRLRGTKLGGKGGWPLEYDGRGLRNVSSDGFAEGGEAAFAELKQKFDESKREAKPERFSAHGRDVTYAGTGVGLINKVLPAKEIVEGVRNGAVDILTKMAGTFKEAKL